MLQPFTDMNPPERLQDKQQEPNNKSQQQRREPELTSGSSKLRILLLGKHGAGKSATGNSILRKKVFESKFSDVPVTKTCNKESGIVGEKEVVIIDTPDLFSRRRQNDKNREEEIRHCTNLCFPGPHILLLVTTLGHYTEEDKEIVKGIQETFGSEATRHLVLLFTRKEELEDGLLEKHVEETDDEYLKELVQTCGGRYCAFNNRTGGKEQDIQIQGLLEKIELVMEERGGQCYAEFNVTGGKQKNTIDTKADLLSKLPDTQERKRCVIRVQPHQKESSLLEPSNKIQKQGKGSELDSRSSKLRILLLGKHGAGKSATGNSILRKKVFESKFSDVPVTKTCEKESGIVREKEVVIIDTPDLFSRRKQNDKDREEEISHCNNLCFPGPHILLLVTTLGHYTEEDKEIVKGIQETFGAEATRHMVLLFTRKEELEDGSLEKHVEGTDDEYLKELVQTCGGRYCAFNNRAGGEEQDIQIQGLLEKMDLVMKEKGGWYYAEFNKDVLGLILVGKSGTGKSSTGNTIMGEQNFEAKLSGKAITKTCKKMNSLWKGKKIIVLDTPSFDLTLTSKDIFKHEEQILPILCLPSGVKVFILVIQLGRFTDEDEKSIRELEAIFGEEIFEYMIVVFTRKDDLGTETLENYLKTSDNQSLKKLIKMCGGRFCAFNNKERGPAREDQVNELLVIVQKLVQRHGGKGYPINDKLETYTQRIKDFQKKSLFKKIEKWILEKVD